MGLVDLIQHNSPDIDQGELLRAIRDSATELDRVLRESVIFGRGRG